MKILVLNAGSSSLKYQLFNMEDGTVKVLEIAEDAATWEGVTKPLVREKMMLEMMDSVFFPEFVEEK